VVGRADVLEGLGFAAAAQSGREKIQHPGTFNANPVSAAAGIAALDVGGCGVGPPMSTPEGSEDRSGRCRPLRF
jgi:hypothetical protein